MTFQDIISSRFQKSEDVVIGLKIIQDHFQAIGDRRAVFATSYLEITKEIVRRISNKFFHDNSWVSHYVVAFAELYRKALYHYERREYFIVPKSWMISFDVSKNNRGLVIQDLLLGINAHINHDLPLSLLEVSIDPQRQKKLEDHRAVNYVIKDIIDHIQERISDFYSKGLGLLDRLLGQLDEDFFSFNFEKARDYSWYMGVALTDAEDEASRGRLKQKLNDDAAILAKLMMVPNINNPFLIDALKYIDRLFDWPRELVPLPLQIVKEEKRRRWSEPPIKTLDDLIGRLEEIISDFDKKRSRLSVYPTVYRRVTKKVKASLEKGGVFRDPDWMESLDVQFGQWYFQILDNYKEGHFDRLAKCWLIALDSGDSGKSIILQDIILQINARVNYDLPIILSRVGLDKNLEDRLHDYKKTYDLFSAELDEVQDMLSKKYTRIVSILDWLGGPFDEFISNFLYTDARERAWEKGLYLFNEKSEEKQRVFIDELDRYAKGIAKKALLWDHPTARWILQRLRDFEDVFQGNWSNFVEDT